MADLSEIRRWIAEAGPEDGGDESVKVTRVSGIASAAPDAVVFAATAEALAAALQSSAGLVLTTSQLVNSTVDIRVLRVRDPRLAFSLIAAHLASSGSAEIHPSAIVHPLAQLAPDVSVGAGSIVAEGVVIGAASRIGSRVVIEAGVVLGERVQVQSGAVLGSTGFGYARRPDGSYVLFPQQGTLVIEDDVEIGANTTIDRGALGETRIGAGTKIDNLVHIAHNCRIGRNVILAAQTGISGSTTIEDGAICGGQVGIGEHATVGAGVILGGGAGVLSGKKLRGPGEVFWGRPAQPLKQYLRDMARLRRGR